MDRGERLLSFLIEVEKELEGLFGRNIVSAKIAGPTVFRFLSTVDS